MGVTRNYAGWLINHTKEGVGVVPTPLPPSRGQQLLSPAQVTPSIIDHVAADITKAGERGPQEN